MTWFSQHLWLYWTFFPIIGIFYFGFGETVAFVNGGETLSAFTVRVCYAWPPLMVLGGLLIGALITHFFWFWHAPVQIGGTGG